MKRGPLLLDAVKSPSDHVDLQPEFIVCSSCRPWAAQYEVHLIERLLEWLVLRERFEEVDGAKCPRLPSSRLEVRAGVAHPPFMIEKVRGSLDPFCYLINPLDRAETVLVAECECMVGSLERWRCLEN